jgi:hypothetical protein
MIQAAWLKKKARRIRIGLDLQARNTVWVRLGLKTAFDLRVG